MTLRIAAADAGLIGTVGAGVVLGIILPDGSVRLAEADPLVRPGHVEWLMHDGIAGAVRGFCLIVFQGRVRRLFPQSRMNPTPDAALEPDLIAQLGALLPLAADYAVLAD